MNDALGEALLTRARNAIAAALGQPAAREPDHPALQEPGAVFVTLTQEGELRGCIGSLQARQPLAADVRANAQAAAFRDPRFPPLSAAELATTRIEVSLLTTPEPIAFTNQDDAIRSLCPGVDGVILEYQGHRGTFLPQVWDTLPERHLFFAQLKRKAGLASDFWSPAIKLYRYRVQKWQEPATPS
jgi:AmmeMemoRadiSam system protein A